MKHVCLFLIMLCFSGCNSYIDNAKKIKNKIATSVQWKCYNNFSYNFVERAQEVLETYSCRNCKCVKSPSCRWRDPSEWFYTCLLLLTVNKSCQILSEKKIKRKIIILGKLQYTLYSRKNQWHVILAKSPRSYLVILEHLLYCCCPEYHWWGLEVRVLQER